VALGLGGLSTVAAHAAESVTATGVARVGYQLNIKATLGTGSTNTKLHYALQAGGTPTGALIPAEAGPVAFTTGVATLSFVDDSALGAGLTTTKIVAGSYRFIVWTNTTTGAQLAPGASDAYAIVNITAGGLPASISSANQISGQSIAATFTAKVYDAANVQTLLGPSETILAKVATTGGSVANAAGTSSTSAIAADAATPDLGSYTFSATFTAVGALPITIAGGGLLTGSVTSASVVLSTSTVGTGLGTLTFTAPSSGTVTTGAGAAIAVAASVSKPSLSFKVTDAGILGGSYPVTVSANGTAALPVGVTAGITNLTVPAGTAAVGGTPAVNGSATLTVTSTAPTVGTSYRVTHNGVTITVTYTAANLTGGTITVTPATGTTAKTLIGGTATVSAKVVDQLGAVASNALVVFTIAGRNNYTATTLTNASGIATYSIVDASTSTTALADTIDVSAYNPGAGIATLFSAESTLTYVSSLAATTVTLTNGGATDSPYNALDASVTFTAKAKDASGVAIAGLPVTFSLGSGVYTAGSLTGYTDANGSATLTVAGTIAGSSSVSAALGGQTKSSSFTVANVAANDAHIVTVSSPAVALVGGRTAQVVATVKDRYGNVVPGARVDVTYAGSAGRVQAVGGIIGSTGYTGTDGTTTIDLSATSNEAGAGLLKTTISGGTTANTATTLASGAAYPAAVTSASTTVTVTAAPVDTSAVDATKAAQAALAASEAALAAQQTALAKQIADFAAAQKAAADAAAATAAANAKAAADAAAANAKAAADAAAAKATADAAAAATLAATQQASIDAAQAAQDASNEATDAANAATDAANNAMDSADAATAAAQDAGDKADAALAAITDLSTKVADIATSVQALSATVAKIAAAVAKISAKVKA
jgi:hypothetical protein